MTATNKPFYWLNDTSRTFLARGYLSEGETPEERIKAIGDIAQQLNGIEGFSDKFFDYVSRGWFSLSTPVWTNFGKARGMPVSCFNTHVEDNVGSILYGVSEIGMMSKLGGGTSLYMGEVRPRGAEITDNGKSTGTVHFLELYQATTNVISQGSSRRGRTAPYLPIDHKDIEEFLDIASDGHVIQDMNHGVVVDDYWLQSMVEGDNNKRKIWGKLLKRRKESGFPYIVFRDNANNQAPEVYKDKGMKINSSNLCVTGDTKILTKDGYKEIRTLAGQHVECWNGKEWSSTAIAKTSDAAKVLKIITSNGNTIEATPEHKWYVYKTNIDTLQEKRTYELEVGDKVPIIHESNLDTITYAEILSIVDNDKIAPTYCGNEPKEHKLVFNGVLTGNCNEIYLPSNEDESFTCVLSSMNLLHYDDWKDTDAVEVMITFLDTVAEEFVLKLEAFRDSKDKEKQFVWEYMKRAHRFTKRHRALGMGVLGWHSLLQSKMVSIESAEAARLNLEVFKTLYSKAHDASKKLADKFDEPEVLKGYGRRNTTVMAIAPTTSSAAILGQVSQSIEPFMSNYYIKDLAKVKTVVKNPYLEQLLESKGYNTSEVWNQIADNDGSVQKLPDNILSPEEKEVFLTFAEISPDTILSLAAIRQEYIDQGQSLNLMIPSNYTAKEINKIHLDAWKYGLKGLYYQHGVNAAQSLIREKRGCKACEG